ncbi:hypothetical protein BKA57DRAFT_199362 [Linnemannia elongata]|nr:hypothetical protein BKA57DRAFT_199362 [Linnemannia elongata]
MLKIAFLLSCIAITLSAVQAVGNPNTPGDLEENYTCSWMGTAPSCGYYCLDSQDQYTDSNYGYRYNNYYCSGVVTETDAVATYATDGGSFGKPCANSGCKIRCCVRK